MNYAPAVVVKSIRNVALDDIQKSLNPAGTCEKRDYLPVYDCFFLVGTYMYEHVALIVRFLILPEIFNLQVSSSGRGSEQAHC